MTNNLLEKKITLWLNHIEELITLWDSGDNLASQVKKRYFNGKKYLGGKDRKIIGGTFYFYLRTLLYTQSISYYDLLYLAYNKLNDIKPSIDYFTKDIDFNTYIYEYLDNKQILKEFDSQKSSVFFPETYRNNIKLADNELEPLLESLNKEATTDLRIVSNKESIIKELIDNQVPYSFNLIKGCIKIYKNIDFNTFGSYKNAFFEIQDEGSQLVSLILNPQNEDRILDYCSGGGGKTIHIAELTNNLATIIATDINEKRLLETERRAQRHNLSSIKIMKKIEVDNSNQKYDKILVDAPCSGSGTLRRVPDLRYTIDKELIDKYSELQLQILETCYSKLEKDGELVYSTCSFFQKENDDVISSFLVSHGDLTCVNLEDRLVGLDIDLDKIHFTKCGIMTLTNKTNTDGFFISILKRVE